MRRPLVLFFTVILFSLYIVGVNLSPCSAPSAIVERPNMQQDFVTADTGEIVLTEHGSKVYLGNGHWRYRSSIGETNTWNGQEYVPYLWNDTGHSVEYAGLTMEFYDWFTLIKNSTHTLVEDGRWQLYYWSEQAGGSWRFLDLYQHSWLAPVLNEENMTFGQVYSDGLNQMNITYLFRNCDEVKISASVLLVEDMTIQLRWQTTGILNAPVFLKDENSFTIGAVFQDLNIMWNDAVDFNGINATFDFQAQDRKIDVLFSDIQITANELYLLDPTYNLAADSDDDYWADPYGTPSHATALWDIWFYNKSTGERRGQTRFSLDIPKDSTINDAAWFGWETADDDTEEHHMYRIDETNVGPLESDSSIPSVDKTPTVEFYTDGGAGEWLEVDVTDLVQEQVELGDWEEDYYIGFAFENQETTTANFRVEDYEHANSNHAYLEIDYTEPSGGESVTIYELIELSDSNAEAAEYHLTVNELIDIAESVSNVLNCLVMISEVIGLAVSASTTLFAGVGIFETIELFDSVTATGSMLATINIFEIIPFFDSVTAEVNPSITVVINEIIPIGIHTIIEGGLEGINIFYDLFFSANSWSYLGPIALVVVGWYLTKKEKFLGILWFIVELLFVSEYLTLVDAHLEYWWHIMLLMFGGLFTCVYALLDRS